MSKIPHMRSDVKKNLAKVARYLIKNPEATTTQIQKELGLSYAAVSRARNNMATYMEKDDRIIALTERDLEIVWVGQEEIRRRLSDENELKKIKTSDLAAIMEKSEKRYQIFRGEQTNQEGGLKQITNIEIV